LYDALRRKGLVGTSGTLDETEPTKEQFDVIKKEAKPDARVIEALADDLNTAKLFSVLHELAKETYKQKNYFDLAKKKESLRQSANLIGFLYDDPKEVKISEIVEERIQERIDAKKNKDFATADAIREELKEQGIILEDRPGGTTDWRRG